MSNNAVSNHDVGCDRRNRVRPARRAWTRARIAWFAARLAIMTLAIAGVSERHVFAAEDPLVTFGQQVINTLLRVVGLLAVAGGLITGGRLIFGASVGGSRTASDAILSAAAIIGGLAFALFAPQIVQNVIESLGGGFEMPVMPQVGGG
jgi:hypothetical protein